MRVPHIAALACASIGAVAMALPPVMVFGQTGGQIAEVLAPQPTRRRRRQFAPASARTRRSRGPQAHSKRKRNLVTHSRRVRRRHRRAA